MENYEAARRLNLQILKTRMVFRQTLQRILKRNSIDMTYEMLQIMHCLWHEQGVSQQILAEKTAKDKACLTNLMGNLEKKGWITRREDPSDRRNRLVYLTPAGEEVNDQIRPLVKDIYSEMGKQMGLEEIESCINQLEKLHEALNQL